MRRLALLLVSAFALCIAGAAVGQESKVMLKDGPGKDKAMQCAACHSADYIPMNSPIADRKVWENEVNKMINAFGAPIAPEDAKTIIDYLIRNYGKPG